MIAGEERSDGLDRLLFRKLTNNLIISPAPFDQITPIAQFAVVYGVILLGR